MQWVIYSLLCLLPLSWGQKRTSCFQYISCMEEAHIDLRLCTGFTPLALAIEAKEKPMADFIDEHRNSAMKCQERLSSDSLDFEVLQILVNEDARECFRHLPESRRQQHHDASKSICPHVEFPAKNRFGRSSSECFSTFRSLRQQCEQFLECCPDHIRCGERLNSVSVAYQHAKSKANEIVQRLLLCLGSFEPQHFLELTAIQMNRIHFRIPGIPFLKPDKETERRIARRLSLMSYGAIEERREKHFKKFQKVRERLLNEEKVKMVNLTTPSSRINPISSKERVAIVRNLFKNAKENELAIYASLLAEGNFARLAELEKIKSATRKCSQIQCFQKMYKAKMFSKKNPKTLNCVNSAKVNGTDADLLHLQEGTRLEPLSTVAVGENMDSKELLSTKKRKNLAYSASKQKSNFFTYEEKLKHQKSNTKKSFNSKLISSLKEDKKLITLGLKKSYRGQSLPLAESRAISVATRTNMGSNEDDLTEDNTMNMIKMQVKSSSKNASAVGAPHHLTVNSDDNSLPTVVFKKPRCGSNNTSRSQRRSIPGSSLAESIDVDQTTTPMNALGDIEEGSSEHMDQNPEIETASFMSASTEMDPENHLQHDMEPHQSSSSCSIYAACLETIRNYENVCEQRYARDYITHGIDDSEVLHIINESSISHGTTAHRVCLRSINKLDYSAVKQLLATQRNHRKRCLEYGTDQINDNKDTRCHIPPVPYTESIDNFLYRTHSRMEINRLTCLRFLDEIKDTCSILEKCCPHTERCESHLEKSSLHQQLNTAIKILINQQNTCERNLLEAQRLIRRIEEEEEQR